MSSHKWLTAFKKVQCEVLKLPTRVFLKSYTSNGTWVNGHKVRIIKTLSVKKFYFSSRHIRLGKATCGRWSITRRFASRGLQKSVRLYKHNRAGEIPTKLTSKYIISKDLGKVACGKVRLTLRIPYLCRVAIKIINKNITTMASCSPHQQPVHYEQLHQARLRQH